MGKEEFNLAIISKDGGKEIDFDFASSNRRAAISLLDEVLQALENYKRKSTSSQEPVTPAGDLALVRARGDQSGTSGEE